MVFERMQEGAYIPRGYMLGYQGFPPFEELGVLHQIRESGWDIAPREDGSTVAIAVNVGTVLHLLARDLPVEYEHVVVDLMRDGPTASSASSSKAPRVAARSPPTSSSPATASTPRFARWRGSRPSSTPSRTRPSSG